MKRRKEAGNGAKYTNVVSVVAKGTKSGKTFLMEQLIGEFKKRGMKIAAVKHSVHLKGVDKEGKDTYKFAQKGADRIVLFSDNALMLYEFTPPEPDYLIDLAAKNMDLVLVEGYKEGPFRKIEVFNPSLYDTPLCAENPGGGFIAIVSRERIDAGLPWYSFDDVEGLCTFIEEHVIR
ncbi:MAG: Molybdopterin-guanine dinucleotide biosynthesis adapter protein [Deltaproteobacteria bacterium ADurb.BinA179]|jgi:molybdopterin-guanine dinucleotide biosynthesis protein MobB|nr:molybdopterin-guanine dinucleotide biosynthesis protein B [Deltaproteobacteria bacterium]MDI9542888.1 molybdopterin-guanine dinucleotide biosynthesis protein B [Pseudomonadota bacterium]NLW68717.1 molybdopterin-guanine dinucleotide biosynthesis protein B [Bacteriovoracaceae bacterium]OPZ26932.1 MAG: Molybdopterin-guanine dinucleotide biosynthesis adapter protein [Deltaproteobacteria bacterium ADurb.BinA179]HRR20248.1 molybdopterin-guanine dinucleotide biosynthesis protein B [Desulfomonilia b